MQLEAYWRLEEGDLQPCSNIATLRSTTLDWSSLPNVATTQRRGVAML